MDISFKVAAFGFVNYVRFEGMEGSFSVGKLTDEQAGQYWDDLRADWIAHVRKRRELDEQNKREFK